ncbi:MAG: hypothetical protein NDJ89_09570 [Oligoflexia bacterium]|nr:hypothetical protein [Oligoflexia bacterium]
MGEHQSVFGKDGRIWSYIKIYDAIVELLTPRERIVQLELALRCRRHSKSKARVVQWKGFPFALDPRQVVISERELAIRVGLPKTTLHRTLKSLVQKRVIRILKKASGEGGGILFHVSDPDDISQLIQRRIARLDRSINKIMAQKNWENTPSLKQDWTDLVCTRDQLKTRLTNQLQMDFMSYPQGRGPTSGPVEDLNPRMYSYAETENQKSAGKEGDGAAQQSMLGALDVSAREALERISKRSGVDLASLGVSEEENKNGQRSSG